MSENPEWIPDFIKLSDFSGDFNEYLEQIYKRFREDLVFSKARFRNACVGVRRIPEADGKGFGFWHCISEGRKEKDRIPDLERCKRIGWIRAVIDNADKPEIDCWTNRRGREKCHLLWYKEQYLVVLAERGGKGEKIRYYLLKTAYCTTNRRRIGKLRKERDAHKKADAACEDDV
jgi:hypothetical protein